MKEDNVRINVKIDEDLRRQVKVKAAKEGVSITDVVIDYLEKWVRK